VCVLPNLGRILTLDISGLRIEGQLDSAETIRTVTGIYRDALDRLRAGETIEAAQTVARIGEATGRPLSDGPFDFRAAGQLNKEKKLAQT
jgi:collagenase-like PrtC family protease